MEELLLRHRAVIDAAVRALEETTPIDGFLDDLGAHVAALRLREPSFWELRVVEHIHSVVSAELKVQLRDGAATEADVARVRESVDAFLRDQIVHLLAPLDHVEPRPKSDIDDSREHLLESFWNHVARCEASAASNQMTDEGSRGDADDEGDDAPPEQASYEAITFDDLPFETGSVNSAPSTEEIPQILETFRAPNSEARLAALHTLAQMSAMELVHCVGLFVPITQGLCILLLDSEQAIGDEALRLLYGIVNHVEDPAQFIDLYFVIVDWVGVNVSSRHLSIAVSDLFGDSDSTLRAVNALRLLHLIVCRVPYHWIHISTELLARAICSTLVVLLLDPAASGNKKMCRLVDVLAVIDPTAKWFTKWTLKVPSRAQLFASLDQTGFTSDFMYAMTRIRPFEAETEPLERARNANMLTILATCANFQMGEQFLRNWAKLPAHLQQQARHREWLGLEKQFQLDTSPDENDNLYVFHRVDRTVESAHGMELEDGGPLGDHAVTGIGLSAVVLHLFHACDTESFQDCLRSACKAIIKRPSQQEDFALLFELIAQCSMSGQEIAAVSASGVDELDDRDPWFPFRRPKSIETIGQYIVDSATKRGLLGTSYFARKSVQLFECLVESMTKIQSVTPRLATALFHCLERYLDHVVEQGTTEGAQVGFVFVNLQRMMMTTLTPFTLGSALSGAHSRVFNQLVRLIQMTADQVAQDATLNFMRAVGETSSSVHALAHPGLWQKCMERYVETWQMDGDLDVRALQLLVLPSANEIFFRSAAVQTTLYNIEGTCKHDLDTSVALNSVPSQAPFQLRQLSQMIASLRGAFASPFAASVFSARGTDLHRFLADTVQQHRQGICRSSPQSEDLCTVGYELLTATAACIPSMVGFYEFMAQCEVRSLTPEDDDSISACSWLESSLTSSLNHVGGHLSHWIRPRPLYQFATQVPQEGGGSPMNRRASCSVGSLFTPTTVCTLDQMMGSIKESQTRRVPLDMVMLSQATWEILADVEKFSSRDADCYRTLTRAFGDLIRALAMSGQSKISEGEAPQSEADVGNSSRHAAMARFPSDGERKLMNTYYKDYCARLGLKATPTMLHVLSKVFGAAAMDCFAVSMLMILDQTHGENDIIEVLQYCATCPNVYALWPRIIDTNDDQPIPALVPLAQAAEMILEVEFPLIFTTLRQCHCSVLTLLLRWHSQCYWNYLPWDSILIMLYLTFLYGVEFQAYFFVVVVRHFEPTIREIIARNSDDTARAYVETLQAPVIGFRFHTARNSFLTLRSTYHDRIQQMLRR